jgi:hypothetical protein
MPYQQLLSELSTNKTDIKPKQKSKLKNKNKKKDKFHLELELSDESATNSQAEHVSDDNDDDYATDDSQDEDEEEEIDAENIGTHDQEILCKDALDNEETLQNDPFTLHFETNVENELIDILKSNLSDRSKLNEKNVHFQVKEECFFLFLFHNQEINFK